MPFPGFYKLELPILLNTISAETFIFVSKLKMFTFRKKFFILALVLFFIEVMIALFIKDRFIRPYVGDFLVVMLMYCAVRSVLNISPVKIAIGVLVFSYVIETLQYFKIVEVLGLQKNTVARTVIGYGFEWFDIIAYTLGVITILILEHLNGTRTVNRREKEERR